MSWDIMLIKTKSNSEPMESINDNDIAPFATPEVVKTIKKKFSNLISDSDDWLDYEGDTYSISFDLSENHAVMLHVHILDEPEDAVLPVIADLCKSLNCRAFDTTSAEFLFE